MTTDRSALIAQVVANTEAFLDCHEDVTNLWLFPANWRIPDLYHHISDPACLLISYEMSGYFPESEGDQNAHVLCMIDFVATDILPKIAKYGFMLHKVHVDEYAHHSKRSQEITTHACLIRRVQA